MAKIKYKGELLTEITDGQPITLHTTGHSLSGDITIEDLGGSGGIIEVDELPTENIDTEAFYLCDGKYYKFQPSDGKTWVFNDELNFDGLEVDKIYRVDYKCVGVDTSYTGFEYHHQANEVYALSSVEYKYGGDYTAVIYYTDSLWGNPAGWLDERYKTIVFSELPTDESLIGWIKNNASASSGEWQECVFGAALIECSSPDELPTDAKEGAAAIIQIIPTIYQLKDEPDASSLAGEGKIPVLFFNNARAFSSMWFDNSSISYFDAVTDTQHTVYVNNEGWSPDCALITVAWASPMIIDWLEQNSTYTNPYTTAFSVVFRYESGQWIAKTLYQ